VQADVEGRVVADLELHGMNCPEHDVADDGDGEEPSTEPCPAFVGDRLGQAGVSGCVGLRVGLTLDDARLHAVHARTERLLREDG
jgi:hypothetical protein